jgi:hypothetical protein
MNSALAPFIVLATILVGGWVYQRFLRIGDEPTYTQIRIADLPRLLHALKSHGEEGSFAVLTLRAAGANAAASEAYVQFSIESGRVGLDWLLQSQRNISDRASFVDVARALGHAVNERETGDVRYLRVDQGDLPHLAAALAERLYGVSPNNAVPLMCEGFEWKNRQSGV